MRIFHSILPDGGQVRTSAGAALAVAAALALGGCQATRNFTTYYNLFYNIERLDEEVGDELEYIRDQKTPSPTYYIPYDEQDTKAEKFYPHLERRGMTLEESRINKVKLDSILIKGSKLLAHGARSDYVDGAGFYIAKAYFYEREWYLSQKKCEELIAGYPNSRYLPDAHLFLSMDMLKQGNESGGEVMLSRTINIAWARERRDILMEAFRLNADVALANGDLDKALKPYSRAIILSASSEDKARWQYEIAVAYFRAGKFQQTLGELDKVGNYSPDLLTLFQTGVQRAVTLRVLGRYDDAGKELDKLRGNQNYDVWFGLVDVEKMNLQADRMGTQPDEKEMQRIDSLYPGRNYSAYSTYEHGVRAFRAGIYDVALANFRNVQSARVPFQKRAQRYAGLLTTYFDQLSLATDLTRINSTDYPDSTKITVADAYYNVARVFSKFAIRDSLVKYYRLAAKWAPAGSPSAARVHYARAVLARSEDRNVEADSLLEVLVKHYPLTEYGAEARRILGYTEFAKIDTAQDLYLSGVSFMKVAENARAVTQFQKVIGGFPLTSFAPQAYYALGLIFEQRFENLDSAYEYYSRLVDAYPTSEQAIAAKPFVDAARANRKLSPHGGGPGRDSTSKNGKAPSKNDDDKLVPLGSSGDGIPATSFMPPEPAGDAPGSVLIDADKAPASDSSPALIKPSGTHPKTK